MLLFKKVPTIIAQGDKITAYVVTTIQSNIKKVVDSILAVALLDQNVFQGLPVVGGTPFTINHGLGRAYTGASGTIDLVVF
jgi:hypothetical protein